MLCVLCVLCVLRVLCVLCVLCACCVCAHTHILRSDYFMCMMKKLHMIILASLYAHNKSKQSARANERAVRETEYMLISRCVYRVSYEIILSC